MKSYADYSPFQAEDFLADRAFRSWIARPTPEMDAYWRGLLQTHPHLKDAFQQARLLALGLEASWTPFSDAYLSGLYDRLQAELPRPVRRIGIDRPLAIAATLALLLIGCWTYYYEFTPTSYRTGYGQVRTVQLYDGSTVTLNANTRLRLPSRYGWRSRRDVWLDGEAYFAVSKQPGNAAGTYRKFMVRTNRLAITVLGTRFNVYARPRRTQVLLDEGRVALSEVGTSRQLLMRPGDLVELDRPAQPLRAVRQTAPTRSRELTAYRDTLLIFTNASMDELTRRFADVYGLKLMLTGPSFAGQQFVGQLPADDLPKALFILSETFGLKAVRSGQQVYFVPAD